MKNSHEVIQVIKAARRKFQDEVNCQIAAGRINKEKLHQIEAEYQKLLREVVVESENES